MEHTAKRFDPLEAGNSRLGETKEKQGELARERSLVLQMESDLQHRKAVLRQQQAGAMKRKDSAASVGGEELDKEAQEAWKELEAARQELEKRHGKQALDPWNTSFMMAGSVIKKMVS